MSSRTALNVGVILVQIWCNTLCDDTHDVHDILRKRDENTRKMHDITRYYTISNGIAKTRRDKKNGTHKCYQMASIIFWWVPFLLSRLVPRPTEHSSVVRPKNTTLWFFLTGSQFSKRKLFCCHRIEFCKELSRPIYFWNFYGIIRLWSYLIDKLGFDGDNYTRYQENVIQLNILIIYLNKEKSL